MEASDRLPPSPTDEKTDSGQPDTITIAVHGTFAGHTDCAGDKWWQSDSRFANMLCRFLPSGVRAAQTDEIFHWSGDNSERARNEAAFGLLKHLKRQEQQDKSYHLIGHSHGGSVIWHALKLAEHTKAPLKGLRSWTTIGTPFLRHRSRGAFSPSNLIAILLTFVLLKPALLNAVSLFGVTKAAILGLKPELIMPVAERNGIVAFLSSPFLSLMNLLGVPMQELSEGRLLIGTFDPSGAQSFGVYMFTTVEGLTIVGTMILACYVFLSLAIHSFAPALESHRIRAEENLERQAFERFGVRWLGLWSEQDEAINGLRATLAINASFVGEMMPRHRVFVSDTPSLVHRPIFWVFAPLYNQLLRPLIDSRVRKIITRSAQGNDRPTAELVAVTPTPVDDIHSRFRSLPPQLEHQLVTAADNQARDIAPKLRRLLSEPTFALGIENFGDALSGRELVHTSYFNHEEIAALIGCNIASGESAEFTAVEQQNIPDELRTWFALSRQCFVGNAAQPEGVSVRHTGPSKAA